MAGRLEALLSEEGSWLGSAPGEMHADLADDADLADLMGHLVGDLGDGSQLLAASRIPRVRPVLVVLAARAAGGSKVDHELQHASELLYVALAVHDLALGNPGGRRRRLARKVLRRSASWLSGNQLLLRSIELARCTPHAEILDDLLETLRLFSESQAIAADIAADGVPEASVWSEHADGHTGALFAFCCRAGAIVGGNRKAVSGLGRYGRHLGRMWHVAEDVCLFREADGAEHLLGRALSGRPTLPVAIAIERDPRLATEWRALADEPELDAAADFLERMRTVGGLVGTRQRMTQEHWAARAALRQIPDSPYRHTLERLASGLAKAPYVERDGPQRSSGQV